MNLTRQCKQAVISAYRRLPFPVQVVLARGNPSLAFYIPPGPRAVLVPNYLGEFLVRVDTHSDVERRMLSARYEPATIAIIARFVRPGQQALDVGANVGAVTFALAKAVGPKGRVDAFEPGPPFFDKLCDNLSLNTKLTNVHTHQLGLGERDAELPWQLSKSDRGNATIHWADQSVPTTSVKVTTIDQFMKHEALTSLHFIKIDVEGMELAVIRGAVQTLRQHRPIIYFESSLCDDEQCWAAQQIETLLADMGYRLYKVGRRGSITRTRYPNLSFMTLALACAP